MFRIWIGNLGKYNEGYLIGEWVDLPCDDFDEVFERIGINDEYEEIFIADYENDYGICVSEYENLEWLNELAEYLESLDEFQAEVWNALDDAGLSQDEIKEIIENGDYMTYGNCFDMSDVAREYYEISGELAEIEKVLPEYYVNWDSIGRDLEIEGYFYPCGNGYVEIFNR